MSDSVLSEVLARWKVCRSCQQRIVIDLRTLVSKALSVGESVRVVNGFLRG